MKENIEKWENMEETVLILPTKVASKGAPLQPFLHTISGIHKS